MLHPASLLSNNDLRPVEYSTFFLHLLLNPALSSIDTVHRTCMIEARSVAPSASDYFDVCLRPDVHP